MPSCKLDFKEIELNEVSDLITTNFPYIIKKDDNILEYLLDNNIDETIDLINNRFNEGRSEFFNFLEKEEDNLIRINVPENLVDSIWKEYKEYQKLINTNEIDLIKDQKEKKILEDLGINVDNIVLEDLQCNPKGFTLPLPKAEYGGKISFTKGGKWELIKTIPGKRHSEGGTDLTIGKDGSISFRRNGSDIKVEYGLVIKNNNNAK